METGGVPGDFLAPVQIFNQCGPKIGGQSPIFVRVAGYGGATGDAPLLWQGIAVDPARPEQPKDAASITHTFRCSNRLARVRRTRQKLLQEEEFLATLIC
ncbi:hypothetical protein BO85DRAFT_129688 [Aspergillus piperis CBS 112811]|uniref:Uncharacterized protein n=1 Tax=Aspergillus piperis CBS 112811 TaxID=1448313 RepID=A0A8G1RD37_9EURO|nr:hypothetical protein BO85DRAFT_129688 [Aspergillus piperis CBS 112811]RAH62235.1 hypothetical protein BO85DRAFT_129688 [Aspergillus piperis CBS 112811]